MIIEGKPLNVSKPDKCTVIFGLRRQYAAAERIFDGLAMLPKHILEKPYPEGRFVQTWALNTLPAEFVGLGPFRVREYLAGHRSVLDRNPYSCQAAPDNPRLPDLDHLGFLFVAR